MYVFGVKCVEIYTIRHPTSLNRLGTVQECRISQDNTYPDPLMGRFSGPCYSVLFLKGQIHPILHLTLLARELC